MDAISQVNTIYNLAQVACWKIDPKGVITWSDNLYKFYHVGKDYKGVSVEEFKERVYPPDYPEFESVVNEAIAEKKSFDLLIRLRRKYGFVWVNIRGKVEKDGTIIGCTQDVDEFKRESTEREIKLRTLEALIEGGGTSLEQLKTFIRGN